MLKKNYSVILKFKSSRTLIVQDIERKKICIPIFVLLIIRHWFSEIPWSSPWTSWWIWGHSWRWPSGPRGWRPHWPPHVWPRSWRPPPRGLLPCWLRRRRRLRTMRYCQQKKKIITTCTCTHIIYCMYHVIITLNTNYSLLSTKNNYIHMYHIHT